MNNKKTLRNRSFFFIIIISLPLDQADADVTFSVFHVNDIHAHFEEVDVYTGRCREENAAAGECYGGVARMYTKLRELQQQEGDKWIFLNAGDYYQVISQKKRISPFLPTICVRYIQNAQVKYFSFCHFCKCKKQKKANKWEQS